MMMYIVIIINMYDPQMMKTLDSFSEMMRDLMASVGMNTGDSDTSIGIYGFIFIWFYIVVVSSVVSILRAK